MSHQFILASGSPRRRELLSGLGLDFTVQPSGAEEPIDPSLSPQLTVERLSLLKAADVAAAQTGQALVLGADTIVWLDGQILGKPRDADNARQMLMRLSGKTHSVFTGISVVRVSDGKCVSVCEQTQVRFRALSEEDISRYLATGEPLDKAGAYGIQGRGALLIERIDGDYFNVVGLPLCRLAALLREEFDFEL